MCLIIEFNFILSDYLCRDSTNESRLELFKDKIDDLAVLTCDVCYATVHRGELNFCEMGRAIQV